MREKRAKSREKKNTEGKKKEKKKSSAAVDVCNHIGCAWEDCVVCIRWDTKEQSIIITIIIIGTKSRSLSV